MVVAPAGSASLAGLSVGLLGLSRFLMSAVLMALVPLLMLVASRAMWPALPSRPPRANG
jgi:hypothetical protein